MADQSFVDVESGTESEEDKVHDHNLEYSPEPLDADVYGAGIAALVRDTAALSHTANGHVYALRLSHLMVTVLLLIVTVFLQVWLIYEMKILITEAAVHDIRKKYSEYEFWMYNGATYPDRVYKTVNNFYRGKMPEYFDSARFATFDKDAKAEICDFPMSQPYLLYPILFIWMITVMQDVRRAVDHLTRFWATPRVKDATNILEAGENSELTVVGLILPLKIMLMTVSLCRIAIDIILLWIGARWLVATPSFADLLLNAVALEFVLLLKEMLYIAVVPRRSQLATEATFLMPTVKTEGQLIASYLGTFFVLMLFAIVVYLYMMYQQVLPNYNYDIHDSCQQYLDDLAGRK